MISPARAFAALAFTIVTPVALIACSDRGKEEPETASTEINQTQPGSADEGKRCSATDDCIAGLVCKPRPHRFPLDVFGPAKTCQVPAEGEEGSACTSDDSCNEGLFCKFDDKGNTEVPGAGDPFPPGEVGLPVANEGTCARSDGPPPGAVGLPIR